MARKRYTTDEIIKHLRTLEIERANGATMEQASKKIDVSAITLTRWKEEYGGLRVDQAKKLNALGAKVRADQRPGDITQFQIFRYGANAKAVREKGPGALFPLVRRLLDSSLRANSLLLDSLPKACPLSSIRS